jgi:hypothetical protein
MSSNLSVIVSVNIAIIRLLPDRSYQILLNICNGRNNKMLVRKKIKDSNLETFKVKRSLWSKLKKKNKDFFDRDASELLNMSTKTIYRLIERKEINSFSFSARKHSSEEKISMLILTII